MGQVSAGSLSVQLHVDVPVEDGLTSIMSDPIEGFSPDEFWALFVMDLKHRQHLLLSSEEPHTAWDKLAETELLVRDPISRDYLVWQTHLHSDEAVCHNYSSDASLSRARWRATIRVHRLPFHLEFWSLVYGHRDSGGDMRSLMARILQTMLSKAACIPDADSPSEAGMKSSLSEPIVDSVLSPEMFWRRLKETLKRRAFKALPDGSVVQKSNDAWSLLWRGETFTHHIFHEDRREIVSCTYSDQSLSQWSLEKTQHLRIHQRPYRLEMWVITPSQRHAGERERALLLSMLGPVLRMAGLICDRGQSLVDVTSASNLQEEIGSFRSEVSDALSSLRQSAVALEEMREQF
mmetsp:Transcript_77958/g.180815  ORF Transcript_77958/g.180815 Transcript_77958/m.180815 type:complete len:349 (-) Transcript_77958:54-1100(-)|eukprot:CAMPEP_0171075402 /NCGR_PEP_ID=MMETSP0766_2-20121228/12757_1 /TAXON_ID=439317 /ORGANISM="Gambierdiscus australes, Strain CAWD 149" /LENGTH=348 /DNA_ID=CAMNT_0011532267 /DNA_START=32 /DNA_END=1078 /DNA_ORIENTATION=+